MNPARSKTFFIIGFCFLMAMALFSSLDASIVYILSGIAIFFIFLGFYTGPSLFQRSGAPGSDRPFQKQSFQKAQPTQPRPATGLADIIRQAKFRFQSGQFASAAPARKIILAVVIIFIVVTMIPILVSLFSSGGDAVNYYSIAEMQYYNGQYDSAYANYKAALQIDPEYEEAMLGLGKTQMNRNERDSAIYMFDKLIGMDADNKEAVYNKGLVYYEQKKYSEGISLMAPVLEANPDYYDAMLLLGDFYYIEQKYDDALSWYGKAYEEGGIRSRMLCHMMAYIYDTKSSYDKAIPLYQEALNYDSTIVDIYIRLGELIPGENGEFYRAKAAALNVALSN